jgi:hypothetical protein
VLATEKRGVKTLYGSALNALMPYPRLLVFSLSWILEMHTPPVIVVITVDDGIVSAHNLPSQGF